MKDIVSYKLFDEYIIRILDLLGAIVVIIISSPLFLIVAILIKLDSKGPVFYTQMRVGRNRRKKFDIEVSLRKSIDEDRRKVRNGGKPFTIYKFRTMKDGAEKKCGPVQATDNDPRVTAIGKILRYSYIEKLPQLINILKGDMSFVGPKPERPYMVNQLVDQFPDYSKRFKIKPGLTGLAQIKTDTKNSLENVQQKLAYDLAYSENQNLKSYFKIIFLTIVQSLITNINVIG